MRGVPLRASSLLFWLWQFSPIVTHYITDLQFCQLLLRILLAIALKRRQNSAIFVYFYQNSKQILVILANVFQFLF